MRRPIHTIRRPVQSIASKLTKEVFSFVEAIRIYASGISKIKYSDRCKKHGGAIVAPKECFEIITKQAPVFSTASPDASMASPGASMAVFYGKSTSAADS